MGKKKTGSASSSEATVNDATAILAEMARIQKEADDKKTAKTLEVKESIAAIDKRIAELEASKKQLQAAIGIATSKATGKGGTRMKGAEKEALTARIVEWLGKQKDGVNSDAIKEQFPEIGERAVSIFLADAIKSKKIGTTGKLRGMMYHAA